MAKKAPSFRAGNFTGYIINSYNVYAEQPIKDHRRWIEEIPKKVKQFLSEKHGRNGLVEKSWRTSSLPQTICKCSAATTNALRGQTSSLPSRISGLVKKEYSLLTALAGAGMIIFPKVTKAVMPATLGVDADGFFDGNDRCLP